MKQKICNNCNQPFDCIQHLNNKKIHCYSRKFCFDCSPFGSKNTKKCLSKNTRPAYIDSLTLEEFKKIINECFSRKEFFKKINMLASGASFKILNRRIEKDKVDISHFKKPQEFFTYKNKISYDKILIKDSNYNNTSGLKKRLIKDNFLKNKCQKCGNLGIHMGEKLVLHLDHINGIRNDNRIENLRLLCPNCHSQTSSYCGKAKKNICFCKSCGSIKKTKKSVLCSKCNYRTQKTNSKIQISNSEIQNLLCQNSLNKISKMLNISFTGLKKHCIKNNIQYKGVQHEGGAVGLHPKG